VKTLPGLEGLSVLLQKTALFIGVGNVLRSDDGIGVYIVKGIKEKERIRVINAEVSIENYIGRVNSINPDVIIITDCVHFGKYPGYSQLLPVGKLQDQTTHTHNISLEKVSELFAAPVWVLGVQPASVSFGEVISPPVLKAAEKIINIINSQGLV